MTTPTTTDAPAITVAPDGHITGIDGMLDQVAGAVVRQVRAEILPELLAAEHVHRTMGEEMGRAAARELEPWAMIGAASLAGIAVFQGLKWWDKRRRG